MTKKNKNTAKMSYIFCIFATSMIDQETIQRIKDVAKIEEVIGEFVSLHKRGANYIGCCPFHTEKTPSFNVNPARGIFKCFGCGEAGDAVSFLMKHEHYTYPEALRYLARKYNITIEEEPLTPEAQQLQSERDALFHVSDFAQKYFADQLFNDEMGKAVGLSYFHGRGMSDEVIQSFGLGYCPDGWTNFYDYAHKNGYSDAVLEKTGLTIFHENGRKSDRFHGRVAFPIYSISGRVLGFSCRTLSKEKNVAKYVNSPESEIYIKGNILYGLFQAKTSISKLDKCYLVEGNVDVVSMHQSGVTNTVASCGTALTINQIRLIRRYTPNVTVLYDGDAAGIHATIKAVNLLFSEGMHVRVVLFPDGDDPDSYAQKYGSTQLQQYLHDHEENFLLYRARQASDIIRRDPIQKAELLKEIAATIALVPDLVERSEYITQCASLFQTAEASFSNSVQQALVSRAQKEFKESQKQQDSEPVTQQEIAPAVVEFVDIAGLVAGASKGEGLGNKFLSNIRECDAIVHVVRCFDNPDVIHVNGHADPTGDIGTIDLELILSDLEIMEKRIDRTKKLMKGGDKAFVKELAVFEKIYDCLAEGKSARTLTFEDDEVEFTKDLQLISMKPVLYCANIDENDIKNDNIPYVNEVKAIAEKEGSGVVVISAKIEEELGELAPEDREMFLEDLGIESAGLDRMINASYDLLGLISYLTAGPQEVRAWTIKKGTKAPQAAGKIHSDFERGFIRAEVVAFDDLVANGTYNAAKEKGLVRSEGKEYVMKDGDVVLFRFNV